MLSIKDQKLIYHLTHFQNLPSILANGLLPRAQLAQFIDVADPDIIEDRAALQLEQHVPFHWFARNPFDGIVQKSRRGERFALIAVDRQLARSQNWKVVPRHPLSNESINCWITPPGSMKSIGTKWTSVTTTTQTARVCAWLSAWPLAWCRQATSR